VGRIIKRFQASGTASPAKKKGRHRKTIPFQDRLIKRTSILDPRLTAGQVTLAVGTLPVSNKAISHRLNEFGLSARRPAKKPLISLKNRRARLEFAKAYLDWSSAQWKKCCGASNPSIICYPAMV
jgi:hypothetical protein